MKADYHQGGNPESWIFLQRVGKSSSIWRLESCFETDEYVLHLSNHCHDTITLIIYNCEKHYLQLREDTFSRELQTLK